MAVRVFSVCLSLMFLVACGEKKEESGPKPLVVITSPDSPPFEFKDTAHTGDEIIGFDIDVIKKIAEHLGRPLKIVEADFSSLIPSLQSGRADMAIAYISATDERKKSVDFSDPYYIAKKDLLILESSPLSSEKELEGKKVAVQLGSASEMMAKEWAKEIPGLSIVALNKIGDLVQELKNNRVQAVLAEDIVVKRVMASTPGLKVIPLDNSGDSLAIAFPKGSPLVPQVNEALKKMKGDIQQLEVKWMIQ